MKFLRILVKKLLERDCEMNFFNIVRDIKGNKNRIRSMKVSCFLGS